MASNFKNVDCLKGRWRGRVYADDGKRLTTNLFDNQDDAARATDTLVYKVKGPGAPTHYPLAAEQKARLDSITLEQLLAEFRAAGKEGQVFSSGVSRHRGVSWNAGNSKWQACIYPRGNSQVRLGYFEDEDNAAAAYDAAAFFLLGSDAKLNFPSRYIGLPPGQAPPSCEVQIPSQNAREKLEAAARGNKSTASKGQKVQKRKPAQTNPVMRKKAAGTGSNVTSLSYCASPGSTSDGNDGDMSESGSSEEGDESSSENLGESCYAGPPLAWLEDSALDEDMQLEGQLEEGKIINPIIFNSILQQLPPPNEFAFVSGMDIVEQVQCFPVATPPKLPQAAAEGSGRAATSSQGDNTAECIGTALQSNSQLPEAARNEADGQQQGKQKRDKEEVEEGGVQRITVQMVGHFEARQIEEGQREAAQEAEYFLRESLDPLGADGVLPGGAASADAHGMGISSTDMPEHPMANAMNISLYPQPLIDNFFPRSSDCAFHMAVADMQLRRMHAELGLLDEHGRMPDEDRPTHMLALRRQLAAESAAQAQAFEDLPPLFSEDGSMLQSLASVRHAEDEQLAELLQSQVAMALKGLPLTVNPQGYTWVLDPEPGPGPLRPKGSSAPNDHPAYLLHYLHKMTVPLEEEEMTKEQQQEHQALRIAAAREICVKGKEQLQEAGAGSQDIHSGPLRAHVPTLGPAASGMSAHTFDGFVEGQMKDRGQERMEEAKVIYEAMVPVLPALYGGNVPPMVWEPAIAGVPSSQDLLVLESKALHAAAKSSTLQAVKQVAAEGVPALSNTSADYDPLLWFCFVRCFFDAWMQQAVSEFARAAQPLYLQRIEVNQKLDELIRRRGALERRIREREVHQQQVPPIAAADDVPPSAVPLAEVPSNQTPYTFLDPESPEAQKGLAAALAAMAEAEEERRAAAAAGPAAVN